MDFLGIGPMELLFIILIALIVLGPKDMLQASRAIGKFLKRLFTSEGWREFRRGIESLKKLPYAMAREAGLDEEFQTISQAARMDIPDLVLPMNHEHPLKTIDQIVKEDYSIFENKEFTSPSEPNHFIGEKKKEEENIPQEPTNVATIEK